MPTPTTPICGVCGATTDAYLCQPCTLAYIQDCLRVPGALAQLRITQARGDVRTTEHTARSTAPAPLPWNEAASTVIRELDRLLRPGTIPPQRGTTRAPLEAIAKHRARSADLFRRHPDSPRTAAELTRLLDRATRVIDRRTTLWNYGPCHCDIPLHGEPTATTVVCPACNTVHDAIALKERQWQTAADALVTQAEAAQWLAIRHDVDPRRVEALRKRINQWVSRSRVTGHPGVIDGQEETLVRFGDVDAQYRKGQAMLTAKAARSAGVPRVPARSAS